MKTPQEMEDMQLEGLRIIKEEVAALCRENTALRLENVRLKQQIEALEPRADVYLYPEFGGES
jgi:regulator of replication initiation timing